LVPAFKFFISLVKSPKPFTFNVPYFRSLIVGCGDKLKQSPLSVIEAPPLLTVFPPDNAEIVVMFVISAVLMTGGVIS
jgi:hypothetical protein